MNRSIRSRSARTGIILALYCTALLTGADALDDIDQSTRITKENWFLEPHFRWALQHIRELTPTIEADNGGSKVHPLPRNPQPIGKIAITNREGQPTNLNTWLQESQTDGFLALHKGKILMEVYQNGMTDRSHHNLFSASKSFVGTLAGIAIDRGQLNPEALLIDYVPEFSGSAYDGATVRQLMDMTIGMDFTENYGDPQSDIHRYSAATNAFPNPQAKVIYDILPELKRSGRHGEKFKYATAHSDALGWVLQRAAGRPLAELLSQNLWSRIGAERAAYLIADLDGTPWFGGGLNITLRDAARFGLLMARNGVINNRQVVPAHYIEDILENAIPTGEAEPGNYHPFSYYRSHWWVDRERSIYKASGIAGQMIAIVPKQELVVIKFSSQTVSDGWVESGGIQYDDRALRAIIDFVDELSSKEDL